MSNKNNKTVVPVEVWRGILVRPAPGGGWHHREIVVPEHEVERFAVERAPTPDYITRIRARVEKWIGNPDLIRLPWSL